ncbi:MAG: hypothetical protein K8R59_02120 [Thermoanaerobaculales bacterium]|nr:hypothetical protein [Thermoanaerobaculales bacterium]
MGFRLVNLDCAACGSAMTGGPHDILFLCTHCGTGALLGDDGIEKLKTTALLPASGRQAQVWKPGWSIDADVVVDHRLQIGGRRTPGWSGRYRYIIPAFPLPLPDLVLLARAVSAVSDTVDEVPRKPCRGGRLQLGDAMVFIRYLVVGAEVQQPDKLASVEVDITPVAHHLTALPFEIEGSFLRCAVTGVKVRNTEE